MNDSLTKLLLEALKNCNIRSLLERFTSDSDLEKLLAELRNEQRSAKFIATVNMLFSIRILDKEDFDYLISSYQTKQLKAKFQEFKKLLDYIEKFFIAGTHYESAAGSSTELIMDKIYHLLISNNKFEYQFSIGNYHIKIEAGEKDKNTIFCKVNLFKDKNILDKYDVSCGGNNCWSKIFTLDKKIECTDLILKIIGNEGMYVRHGDKELSIIGHIITDKSKYVSKNNQCYLMKKKTK